MLGGLLVFDEVTTPQVGVVKNINLAGSFTLQSILKASTGSVDASLKAQLSNDPKVLVNPSAAAWIDFPFTLTGVGGGTETAVDSEYTNLSGPWQFIRGVLDSVTPGAKVSLIATGANVLGSIQILQEASIAQVYPVVGISLKDPSTIQLKLSGVSGSLSAVVKIGVSNDPLAALTPAVAAWETVTYSISGTGIGPTYAAKSLYENIGGNWQFLQVEIVSISGTGAAVDLTITGA